MKNKLFLLIIAVLIATLPAFAAVKTTSKKAAPKPKPAVVKPAAKAVEWAAKVNNDLISMDLFNKRAEAAIKEITKKISIEAAEEKGLIKDTKKSILEQMIEAVILMQWADREGLEISDKTIKARITQIKKSFPSAHEFHKSLAEQGMTVDDLGRDIKKQIIVDKLIDMRSKATAVTDEEMKAFYYKNLDLYYQEEKLHLQQVFSKDENDIRAEKAGLDGGKKFSGEDIGVLEKSQLPVYDGSQIFKLKPGDISDIASGEAGYYIFKIMDSVPARETKFADVKDNIRKFLLKEKGRTKYVNDLQEEKTNAKIILNEKLGKLF
jgi:parvulin-like peptidyl-prolyl isomerase